MSQKFRQLRQPTPREFASQQFDFLAEFGYLL